MKKKIFIFIFAVIAITCLAFGISACGNSGNSNDSNNGKEMSFKLICPTEMMAGERIEITFEKSYDFHLYHKDFTWNIIGENTVDGSFEFEDLDKNDNYINQFFRAKLPGTVSIQATNTSNGPLTSDIVTITVKANKISTVDELKGLANTNKTVELGADLDLAGENWTPINGFTGTLIGGDYKIKNLTINSVNDSNLGLFGTLQGTVKNLTIENANITSRGDVGTAGILCGTNQGTIDGVTVFGTINPLYYDNVGGVVGYNNNGFISNCTNNATVIGNNNVGGIAGNISASGNDKINNNSNNGEIQGTDNVGGIVGYCSVNTTIVNDINNNIVKGNSCVGGIFGKSVGSTEISESSNSAEIQGRSDYVGGLVGYATSLSKITVCENKADINGGNYVGGYVGYSSGTNIQAAGSENNNTITGKGYVGGFAGYTGVIQNAINSGTIISTGVIVEGSDSRAYVGGIAGYCNGLIQCVNNADIKVNNGIYVGGLVGYVNVTNNGMLNNNENKGEVVGTDKVGGIAGYLTMPADKKNITYTVENNKNTNIVRGNNCIGGIIGEVYGMNKIINYGVGGKDYYYGYFEISILENVAEIIGVGDYIGGLIGYGTRVTKLNVCSNTANISGGNYVGGFVGYSPDTNIKATGQTNNNIIAGKGYVGGFAGYSGIIENAINNGEIVSTTAIIESGNSRSYVGGIAGYCTGIISCTNNADIKITDGSYVGGLVGYLNISANGRADNNINNGEIEGKIQVGGIAGYLTMPIGKKDVTYTVKSNKNINKVKGNDRVGGIFGEVYGMNNIINYGVGGKDYFYGYFEITYCTNEAEIIGNSYVGGIVGYYTRLKTDANLMDTNTTLYGNKLGM